MRHCHPRSERGTPEPGLASDRVSKDRASIATVPCEPPPRDCLRCLHIKRALRSRDCRPPHGNEPLHCGFRRVAPSAAPTRQPIPFLHDPQGAQQPLVRQARGTGAACRPSSLQGLEACQSKVSRRVRQAGFECGCLEVARPPVVATARSFLHRSGANRIPFPARDNRPASGQ